MYGPFNRIYTPFNGAQPARTVFKFTVPDPGDSLG
jgi:hypothetical protein